MKNKKDNWVLIFCIGLGVNLCIRFFCTSFGVNAETAGYYGNLCGGIMAASMIVNNLKSS
jgi:hypothetical protein